MPSLGLHDNFRLGGSSRMLMKADDEGKELLQYKYNSPSALHNIMASMGTNRGFF